jgi:hypothetical protein
MSLFTAKEISRYSLTKALSEISNSALPGFHGVVTGLEAELHDTLSSRVKEATGSHPNGFLIPIACLKAQNVTTATAGGFLVGTELAAIVPALRSKSVAVSMGATVFENLRSNLGVPTESTTSTAQWLTESGELTGSDATYSQMLLVPRRCASMATLSKQLLAQNSLGVELFVRDSLLRTVATALDKGAIAGVGGAEPIGILNYEGTGSITFGATATRAKLISFQDSLTTANAGNTPDASLGYVTSPVTASKWQQIPEVATFPKCLWDGNQWEGTVAGLPARSTTSITDDRVVAGDWTKLVIGFWNEAIEILADPFTQKKTGLVEFLATVFADTGLTNAANFAVSADSGAQ